MQTARGQSPAREILALSEPERQELARGVLPVLLTCSFSARMNRSATAGLDRSALNVRGRQKPCDGAV